VQFPIRIPIRFVVRFAAKGVQQDHFDFVFAEMCKQTIVMGDRKRIGSLFCFLTNLARNRMAIRTQIRTRVDSPLHGMQHAYFSLEPHIKCAAARSLESFSDQRRRDEDLPRGRPRGRDCARAHLGPGLRPQQPPSSRQPREEEEAAIRQLGIVVEKAVV
jgi:hypothetical protein